MTLPLAKRRREIAEAVFADMAICNTGEGKEMLGRLEEGMEEINAKIKMVY